MQAGPGVPPQPPPTPGYGPAPQTPGYYPPSQGYYYPQVAPPPQSGMSTALIVVIVVVILVAVFMVPVMYVMMTGLSTPPGETRPTMAMAASQWSGTGLTVTILSISTATLDSNSLTYQVRANNGTMYFSGAAGTSSAVNGVVITVSYNDARMDGRVGADDNIAIQVAQPSDLAQIHGTQFRVLQGADTLGTIVLP